MSNTFNTAKWDRIEGALHAKEGPSYINWIVQSYHSCRQLLYGDGNVKTVTCGVPQGSVIGPLLWNLMYDDLLKVGKGGNTAQSSTTIVAFADDVAVITTGHMTLQLEAATNGALETVVDWMHGNGLELSVHKTEAIVFHRLRWAPA